MVVRLSNNKSPLCCFFEQLVDTPFRGVPVPDGCAVRGETLLDPSTTGGAVCFRKANTCILVDFTEEVLNIDKLKLSRAQALEVNSAGPELLLLVLGHRSDDIPIGVLCVFGETLRNSATGARSRNDELGFLEVDGIAVVQINGVLVGEEIAKKRIRAQQIKKSLQRPAGDNLPRQAIIHHVLKDL